MSRSTIEDEIVNDEINAAIAARVFKRPNQVWSYTTGAWTRGRKAGQLCAATELLVAQVARLGLTVSETPHRGREYCLAVLRELDKKPIETVAEPG